MKRIQLNYYDNNHGFTLLEVLVALGIAATSLIALYTLANQLLNNSVALEARQAALWCADNHLVTVSLESYAPPIGETQHICKQMNAEFTVKRVMSNTLNPLFRRIELSVYAANMAEQTGTNGRLAFLTTVMLIDNDLSAVE
ncbi:MAG: type secretion system minor pseudopilin GspI [Pseudomonadota bacterium]|jgi:general secretion pathway protein I